MGDLLAGRRLGQAGEEGHARDTEFRRQGAGVAKFPIVSRGDGGIGVQGFPMHGESAERQLKFGQRIGERSQGGLVVQQLSRIAMVLGEEAPGADFDVAQPEIVHPLGRFSQRALHENRGYGSQFHKVLLGPLFSPADGRSTRSSRQTSCKFLEQKAL